MAEKKAFVTHLPEGMHRQLKIESAKTGKPMREIIEEALQKELKKRKVTHGKLRRRTHK
jgi:hypothetical protein